MQQVVTNPIFQNAGLSAEAIVMLMDEHIKAANVARPDSVTLGIKSCIDNKVPAWKIIREVKMMIEDSRHQIAGILGDTLTDTIENFIPCVQQ